LEVEMIMPPRETGSAPWLWSSSWKLGEVEEPEFVEGDGGNKRLIIDCAGCAIEAGAVCPVLWVSAAGSRVDFCESGTRTIGAKWPRVGVTVGNFIHNAAAIEGV
jgi:hypothetical protein